MDERVVDYALLFHIVDTCQRATIQHKVSTTSEREAVLSYRTLDSVAYYCVELPLGRQQRASRAESPFELMATFAHASISQLYSGMVIYGL